MFDGVGNKNSKLLLITTTNHIEEIPPGLLRPGRLDYVVEIAGLDRDGTESLFRAVIPPSLLEDEIDFDAVYAKMQDFQPAWIRAVASRALELAIARHGGGLVFKIGTIDLVDAATSLHKQLTLMLNALEGRPVPELHEALARFLKDATNDVIDNSKIVDSDGDPMWALSAGKA
jgi:transitional endoplasmic reticulum ATPase